jgi:hypothetical protein
MRQIWRSPWINFIDPSGMPHVKDPKAKPLKKRLSFVFAQNESQI